MTHPIPDPRPSSDPLYLNPPPLPRRRPLEGPFCPACEHPSCRRRRAARLPLLGGHRSEYSREHALAAAFQRRNPCLVIWYGEKTGSYWVASSTGLAEASDIATLARLLEPASALA
ncbi:hypothetical protein [Nocardiopsis quinghaiensis]|uniref:hypothetical protein n=1 Tax=Nocardiopsis quinghaiensis TaxID=464995 RepID=UPI001238D1A2|nr:hypothetical protein [Nocardiopsis quinghaiensis]